MNLVVQCLLERAQLLSSKAQFMKTEGTLFIFTSADRLITPVTLQPSTQAVPEIWGLKSVLVQFLSLFFMKKYHNLLGKRKESSKLPN